MTTDRQEEGRVGGETGRRRERERGKDGEKGWTDAAY